MREEVIRLADRLCVVAHFLTWLAAAVTWSVNWWREGPAPSGPLYNSAFHFIGRVDALVFDMVREWTIKLGLSASNLLKVDLGACFNITFACLILATGSRQWFLLGRLVQWVAARKGPRFALVLLGTYCIWVAFAVFLWVAI